MTILPGTNLSPDQRALLESARAGRLAALLADLDMTPEQLRQALAWAERGNPPERVPLIDRHGRLTRAGSRTIGPAIRRPIHRPHP